MRILFLHKYGQRSASFRYRLQQYIPFLEAAGFECETSSLFDDDQFVARIVFGVATWSSFWAACFQRLELILGLDAHRYDLVVIHFEVVPYFPALFERYLEWRKIKYIYDFDDAVFHKYDLHRSGLVRLLLGGKIRQVLGGAAQVFAGNEYLADYARKYNPKVKILPTVVDLARYSKQKNFHAAAAPFTVGWIGSPASAPYLHHLESTLRKFCRLHDARVILVGSGRMNFPDMPLEVRPWSELKEMDDLLEFDIGIMPLIDTPWSRGKCGIKLIQYMGCGIPVIGTPVGVNRDIVVDGETGFWATNSEEWLSALTRLRESTELRERFGHAARARVEKNYCLAVTAASFVESVRETVDIGR